MLSKPLFLREVKANYKIWLIFLAVLTMYGTIIIAMFDPKLGDSIKMMAESMPEMFAAFGMSSFSMVLVEFLGDLLYGFIFIVIPLIFLLLTVSRIVTRYLDRGSMAYLLATPNSRKKIITTQAMVLILGCISMVLYISVLGIITSTIMFPGELDINKFLVINVGLFFLLFFLSGFSFASACLFNEAKMANGVGMGVCIVFLLLKMLSQASDKAKVIKYATPITLYDPAALIQGKLSAYIGILILFLVGLLFYGIAVHIFMKKDLSL